MIATLTERITDVTERSSVGQRRDCGGGARGLRSSPRPRRARSGVPVGPGLGVRRRERRRRVGFRPCPAGMRECGAPKLHRCDTSPAAAVGRAGAGGGTRPAGPGLSARGPALGRRTARLSTVVLRRVDRSGPWPRRTRSTCGVTDSGAPVATRRSTGADHLAAGATPVLRSRRRPGRGPSVGAVSGPVTHAWFRRVGRRRAPMTRAGRGTSRHGAGAGPGSGWPGRRRQVVGTAGRRRGGPGAFPVRSSSGGSSCAHRAPAGSRGTTRAVRRRPGASVVRTAGAAGPAEGSDRVGPVTAAP